MYMSMYMDSQTQMPHGMMVLSAGGETVRGGPRKEAVIRR